MSTKAPLPNTSPKRATTMADLGLTPGEAEMFVSGAQQVFGTPQTRNAPLNPDADPASLPPTGTPSPKPNPSPKPKAAKEGALEKLAFKSRKGAGKN